ncbi:MAG TPA: AI-2E family transporter [Saprospiraceae bacterium]|nr:AI-2E family transporter [Saprospiraceae bacterium]
MLKLPFYAKASLLIIGLYAFISILSITKGILLPVIFAIIIAILISPVINFLVKHGIHRTISITGVLIIAFLILTTLVIFLSSQASLLFNALPELTDKFQELLNQSVTWCSAYFNISAQKINAWVINIRAELSDNSNMAIANLLSSMGNLIAAVMITLVYIFLILFYKPLLLEFVYKLFGTRYNSRVDEILVETKSIIQSYLFGLFTEFVVVAVLNSVGLLILGIQYALLFGIAGAFLNVIPYLGGVIAMTIFAAIALVTKEPIYVFYVLLLYLIVQFIDNNYIVPKIVASKVKLNAFVSIFAVLAGAALWGIPGMILSIPLTAIMKLIFDRIDAVKPWGFLLGDTSPPLVNLKLRMKRNAKHARNGSDK